MGWEDIAPEVPMWRQEFNACKNCDRFIIALEQINTLSENRGSGVSWAKVYEEAQNIARKALEGKQI